MAGIVSGKRGEIAIFRSAVDDIGSPPLGVERPDHVSRISTVYRRDDAVRQFVLRQANGKCEYCGALAFELPNGNGYLEAHPHYQRCKTGPDEVGNVINLCAHYHREARYGRDAENLEAFL